MTVTGNKDPYPGNTCKMCGSRLFSDSNFCEQCGTPVQKEENISDIDRFPFDFNDWKNRWKAISRKRDLSKTGLIITNTEGCPDRESFLETVTDYAYWVSKTRNIDYYILDLKTQNIGKSIGHDILEAMLEPIYSISMPDFLFILGDEKSIPLFAFENRCKDDDSYVYSDLPYVILNARNPFDGLKVSDIKPLMPVGRIPSKCNDNHFLASEYLINSMAFHPAEDIDVFGLSASEWIPESNSIFSCLGQGNVLTSPPVTKETNILQDRLVLHPGMLYFNLHGSNETEYWYGQMGRIYPEAIEPSHFLSLKNHYAVGVEACYGASYVGRDNLKSILKSALGSGCLAFLGSSGIAYGSIKEPGCCADVMVGSFLKNMNNGKTAGEAYISGILDLLNDSMDDAEIKTLAEFALYGDPSVSLKAYSDRTPKQLKRINVAIPEIRRISSEAIINVNASIKARIDSYVYNKYRTFAGTESFVMSTGKHGYQSVYSVKTGSITQILKVYYDSEGNIKKEYHSR